MRKPAKIKEFLRLLLHPREMADEMEYSMMRRRSRKFVASVKSRKVDVNKPSDHFQTKLEERNPLRDFFESNASGNLIWKWEHYFEIYHRHFSGFVGKNPKVLEIGIYEGGSLQMWKHYFGEGCQIFGVDIDPKCVQYEGEGIRVFTGDQEDRGFWKSFAQEVSGVDIIIDDGGHQFNQQIVTLESIFGLLNPGGVYICEDIICEHNHFSSFACGIANALNSLAESPEKSGFIPSAIQKEIEFVQFHPFLMVIKKRKLPLEKFEIRQVGLNKMA